MNKVIKTDSTSAMLKDQPSIGLKIQNVLSFRRLSHRPTVKSSADSSSFLIVNSFENDPATRSILIENASKQRGFLPYDYRISSTFDSIKQKRTFYQGSTCKFPVISPPNRNRSNIHLDVFGNSTNTLSKLAEQRLILREKTVRKKNSTTPNIDKYDTSLSSKMSDADFVSDIPNSLELLFRNTNKKTTMERCLSETMKRQRLQQARYRLLPINRSPNA